MRTRSRLPGMRRAIKTSISLVFLKNNSGLISLSSADYSIQHWDLTVAGTEVARYEGQGRLHGIALNPSGTLLTCCSDAGTLFHLDPQSLVEVMQPWNHRPYAAAFDASGKFLAIEDKGRLLTLQADGGDKIRYFPPADNDRAHKGAISFLGFSKDGAVVVSACANEQDRKVKVWESSSGRLIATLPGGGSGPLPVAIDPRGGALALAQAPLGLYRVRRPGRSDLGRPRLISSAGASVFARPRSARLGLGVVTRHRPAQRFAVAVVDDRHFHESQVYRPLRSARSSRPTLALHPGGDHAVAAGLSTHLVFQAIRGKAPGMRLGEHDVAHLCYASEGRYLCGVVREKEVHGWDLSADNVPWRWNDPSAAILTGQSEIYSLAAGSSMVLAGGRDGITRVLQAADGRLLRTLPGMGNPVRTVATTPAKHSPSLAVRRAKSASSIPPPAASLPKASSTRTALRRSP